MAVRRPSPSAGTSSPELVGALAVLGQFLFALVDEAVRQTLHEELRAIASRDTAPTAEEVLDTAAAKRLTGRSDSTLRRWRRRGLPYVQTEPGGKISYTRSELIGFLRGHARSVSSDLD